MSRRLVALISTQDKTPEAATAEVMAAVAEYEAAKQDAPAEDDPVSIPRQPKLEPG